jgi:hypothetical protein
MISGRSNKVEIKINKKPEMIFRKITSDQKKNATKDFAAFSLFYKNKLSFSVSVT